MPCISCDSDNLGQFVTELGIQLPGIKNIHEPPAYVSPTLVVCFDCGFTHFVVPENGLRKLARGRSGRLTLEWPVDTRNPQRALYRLRGIQTAAALKPEARADLRPRRATSLSGPAGRASQT